MIQTKFLYLTPEQSKLLKEKAFELLESHGVKLDPHPQMFENLKSAGLEVDENLNTVKFPKAILDKLIDKAPKSFILGYQNPDKSLHLPHPDGTFYARTGTGAHGYIDPDTGHYRKVTLADLSQWANLINQLDEISFLPLATDLWRSPGSGWQ